MNEGRNFDEFNNLIIPEKQEENPEALRMPGALPFAHEIEELGAVFWLENEHLMTCAVRADGEPDIDNIGEVTAPESQEALDLINNKLGTNFRYENFAGR